MEERKKARKILTYDDVLSRLRETLFDEQRGPAACDRLRERYDVVLVDEFQDTDPVQWDIMHRAFGEGGATLVLIGDPKQAIYAFRGADVHAYLQARDEVQSEWTLDVNWRSDQGLLEAYDALFGDAQLGYAGIAYRRIRAAEANQQQRLVGCPVDVPLRVRIVHADDGLVPLTAQRQLPKAADARSFIARDLAAERRPAADGRPRTHHPQPRGRRARTHDGASRSPRRPGADEQPGGDRARCAARRGRPGGDRWLRLGLRHRAGAGMAPAARGARTAHGAGPGIAGRSDLLRWLDARRGGDRGRSRVGGVALVTPPVGDAPARAGRRLALPGGQQLHTRYPSGCWRGRPASGS